MMKEKKTQAAHIIPHNLFVVLHRQDTPPLSFLFLHLRGCLSVLILLSLDIPPSRHTEVWMYALSPHIFPQRKGLFLERFVPRNVRTTRFSYISSLMYLELSGAALHCVSRYRRRKFQAGPIHVYCPKLNVTVQTKEVWFPGPVV